MIKEVHGGVPTSSTIFIARQRWCVTRIRLFLYIIDIINIYGGDTFMFDLHTPDGLTLTSTLGAVRADARRRLTLEQLKSV